MNISKNSAIWLGVSALLLGLIAVALAVLPLRMPDPPAVQTELVSSPIQPAPRSEFRPNRPPAPSPVASLQPAAQRDAATVDARAAAAAEWQILERIELLESEYAALEAESAQMSEQVRRVEAEFMFSETPDPALTTRRNMLRSRLAAQDREKTARLNQIQELRLSL